MALRLWKKSKEDKARRESSIPVPLDSSPPGDRDDFWVPQAPPVVDTSRGIWSVRFVGNLRVGTSQAFRSLEEAMAVCTLWERDYNGYAGKRPFYRAIALLLIRKMAPENFNHTSVGYLEYVSECRGAGNFIHSMGELPILIDGSDLFYQAWNFRGRSGFIRLEITINNLDENPSYPPIFSPLMFKNEEEFVSSSKILGIKFHQEGDDWVIEP